MSSSVLLKRTECANKPASVVHAHAVRGNNEKTDEAMSKSKQNSTMKTNKEG